MRIRLTPTAITQGRAWLAVLLKPSNSWRSIAPQLSVKALSFLTPDPLKETDADVSKPMEEDRAEMPSLMSCLFKSFETSYLFPTRMYLDSLGSAPLLELKQ